MSVTLLDVAKAHLTDAIVGQVSTMLGEDPDNTQKAFSGALPVLLSGLIQKSAEPGGNGSLMDMMGQATTPDYSAGDITEPVGGLSGNLDTILADDLQSERMRSMGAGMIYSLFGDRTNAIIEGIASYSGINQTSASTLMSIAGPVLFSVLGKKMADEATGVSGLSGLLTSQADSVQAALPPGLGSLTGFLPELETLAVLDSVPDIPTATPADPFSPPVPPAEIIGPATMSAPGTPAVAPLAPGTTPVTSVPPADPVRPVTPMAYTREEDTSAGSGNKWLPWLLLLLGAGALFFLLRSCRNDGTTNTKAAADSVSTSMNDAASTMSATADSVGSDAGAAMDSAGTAVSDATARLGAFFKRKLPSGLELNIPEKGIENNLVTFIEDNNRPVDKTTWFNFDRLLFDTGKATLTPDSQEQVSNIAAILKEYPAVAIKLGGYTDNTGSAALNKKLSQERANTVMGKLADLGIDKSRLEAEGYGPEHPVASNDTEAGRAENRRIAIRVTKK